MSSTPPGVNANRYDILSARSDLHNAIVTLKGLVTTAMVAGWEPAGGVVVLPDPIPTQGGVTVLQTMVHQG